MLRNSVKIRNAINATKYVKNQPIAVSKRGFAGRGTGHYHGYDVNTVFPKTHQPNITHPPDLMKGDKKWTWHPRAVDEEPLPVPDIDERRSDTEEDYVEVDNAEVEAILDEEYVEPEIYGIFRNYQKLVNICQPVRFFNKNMLIHPTLKKATYKFFTQAETDEHYHTILSAAWRCHEVDFYDEMVQLVTSKGYVLNEVDKLNYLRMATFKRSHELFHKFMDIIGPKENWSKQVYLDIIGFHEMMQEFKQADEIFADIVNRKIYPAPWRPLYRSHYYARRKATEVFARTPMWDEPSPIADVVQINGLPILQARAALRYAIYSYQGLINTDAHKQIRIPHHMVVQCVRRVHRGQGKNSFKAWEWAPMKGQLMNYLEKYGCTVEYMSHAGNCFSVHKDTFSKLPTPETLL